jgi:hypothetical protein
MKKSNTVARKESGGCSVKRLVRCHGSSWVMISDNGRLISTNQVQAAGNSVQETISFLLPFIKAGNPHLGQNGIQCHPVRLLRLNTSPPQIRSRSDFS